MGRKSELMDIINRQMIIPCGDGVAKPSQYVDALVEELNRYVLSNDSDAYEEGRKDGIVSKKEG